MLSFLRESNSDNLPAKEQSGQSQNNTNNQQESEYLTVASRTKTVRKTTTLLAALFIIGLIGLFFMIKKSAPKSASAAENISEKAQIEAAIVRLTGIKTEMFNKMDEIVQKFYEFSDVQQVEVDELLKNPFLLESFLADLEMEDQTTDQPIVIDVERVRKEQLRQEVNKMQLVSIMQSAKGICCMIDNEILYVGDEINDFKISQINGNIVKLESEDFEFVLTLSK